MRTVLTDKDILDRVRQLRSAAAVLRRYAASPVVTLEELPYMTGEAGLAKIEEKRARLEMIERMDRLDKRLEVLAALHTKEETCPPAPPEIPSQS